MSDTLAVNQHSHGSRYEALNAPNDSEKFKFGIAYKLLLNEAVLVEGPPGVGKSAMLSSVEGLLSNGNTKHPPIPSMHTLSLDTHQLMTMSGLEAAEMDFSSLVHSSRGPDKTLLIDHVDLLLSPKSDEALDKERLRFLGAITAQFNSRGMGLIAFSTNGLGPLESEDAPRVVQDFVAIFTASSRQQIKLAEDGFVMSPYRVRDFRRDKAELGVELTNIRQQYIARTLIRSGALFSQTV